MCHYQKKVTVTLRPEWEPVLKQLKQEKFNDGTQVKMLRYIIELGLDSARAEHTGRQGDG